MNAVPPLVSIGLPVYNEEQHISAALDSLLKQTFQDFEIVISDNASTDQTENICREYALKDPRIKYQRLPVNVGAHKNFEGLLRNANSKYFMWAAADDAWDERFLELCVEALEKDEDSACAFGAFLLIDGNTGSELERRAPDYTGSNPFIRISRFAYQHDDCTIYGLFRHQCISTVPFPVWWSVNKSTPLNTAYPMICYFLVAGGYSFVGDAPIFYKKIHPKARWEEHVSGWAKKSISLSYYFAFILRIINVFVFCLIWVYKASHSVWLVMAVAFPLFFRYIYILVSETILTFVRLAKKFLRD